MREKRKEKRKEKIREANFFYRFDCPPLGLKPLFFKQG